MDLKRVGVMFFRDQKVCCCQEAFGFNGREWNDLCVRYGDRLVTEIQRYRTEARFSIDYLPPSIREEYLRNGFRHLIPIRFKDKLVGTAIHFLQCGCHSRPRSVGGEGVRRRYRLPHDDQTIVVVKMQ